MVMRTLNVLAVQRASEAERAQIAAVDPAIRLTDAGGWFDGEIRDTWPAATSARYLSPAATGHGTRAERDQLLAEAEVILGGWPFPLDLRARSPRLKWFHQRPAGASNLLRSDLWGSDVVVTTSRGAGNTLAMAEYAVAGILHFAKALDRAVIDRDTATFSHRGYRPLLLHGKTACVVGTGGIGLEVGRLCGALGMHVVGTRRHPRPGRAAAAGLRRTRRCRRPGPLPAAQRLRRDLLSMDAGNHPIAQPRPLRPDEDRQRAGERGARRDRR